MTFNICMGGRAVDIAKVSEAIVAAHADVVGLQEAGADAPLIAQLSGLAHVDERHTVVSRWPLAEPSGADGTYVYVHPEPTTAFAIANVHLPAEEYGPYLLRDGLGVDQVIATERAVRLTALRRSTPAWKRLMREGVPLVVTGDFNVPAHTDWGTAWSEHRSAPTPWPVSREMADLGFTDTYRAANPERAGLTWTYGYPHPLGNGSEPRDRIDFVWAAGHVGIGESIVVGPAGVTDVGVTIDPWPSDHLGVVTDVTLTPIEPEPYVAPLAGRVEVGELLHVRFATAGNPGERIAVASADAAIDDALMWVAPMEVTRFGEVTFGTAHLAPGEYDVILVEDGGEVGRRRIWLVDRGEQPRLRAALDGDSLVVSWHATHGRRFDWIGVYPPGVADLEKGAVARAETGATISGSHTFGGLGDGPFTVRLIADSTIAVLAETEVVRNA